MENNENNKERVQNKNLIPLKPGQTANPNGRPKGQRNYATIYREALIKLAEGSGKTPEDIETEIHLRGLIESRKGNIGFYRDVLDRLHGKAPEKVDFTSNGETVSQASIDILEIAKRVSEELKKKKT
jgi:hypothetical protein